MSDVVKREGSSLEEFLTKMVHDAPEETAEAINARIIEQNANAASVDDLFVELQNAKDDMLMVPFIARSIAFRESTMENTSLYAIVDAELEDGSTVLFSVSSPDVWSKLFRMDELGAMQTTPVRIIAKQTRSGKTALKLTRVADVDWKSKKASKKGGSDTF